MVRPAGTYLRLSLTAACDLRCAYCRPAGQPLERTGVGRPASDAEMLALVREIASCAPIRKVRLTGGEPLLRRGVVGIVAGLRRLLPGAALAMTTNGQRLAALAPGLRDAGLDTVNVSLDTLDEERFTKVSPTGTLAATIDGIEAAARVGFAPLKLNTVLLRSINGEHLDRLVAWAAARDAEIRFIELMPIGAGAHLYPREFLSTDEALERLRDAYEHAGPLGLHGTAVRHAFRVDGRTVPVGFISPVSSPFCAGCDRLRLDSWGRLVGCLRDDDGLDLLGPLRRGARDAIAGAIRNVLQDRGRPGTRWPSRTMYGIGG